MKCHYDVLSVARDASLDEIKKSYKKLAIKWHPDKNLDNTEAATEQFQLIQQAFEVLSDPHERAWYDDHRDAILKGKVGGECEDDSLDVYQYFTASCYNGFGDDEKGFYSVYREVFNKISAEDSEYFADGDSDIEIPNFGRSDSSAEEVKHFYAYWQSYCTKKSYSFLDPYDTRTAENRRVSRLIDKENKKVRDKAKKARNEEVRELVNFVRKRDKRIQAHAQQLQKLNTEKANKTEEKRREKIKKRNAELSSHKESEWSKFSNFESELRGIEATLASEFGESASDDSYDSIIDDRLYCVACNKLFKTAKAFENHESSKKHKENVTVLKQNMLEGSDTDNEDAIEDKSPGEESSVGEGEVLFEYDGHTSDNLEDDELFCNPCGKEFKTTEDIEKHNETKKHKEQNKIYQEAMGEMPKDNDKHKRSCMDYPKMPILDEIFKDVDASEPFDPEKESERLCNEIDKFTKDNDGFTERVDKLCKDLDDLYDEDHYDSDGKKLRGVYTIPSEILMKYPLEPLLDRLFLSEDDDEDFFSGTKRKQKKKRKTKSKLQSTKKNQEPIPETKIDSTVITSNEKESDVSSVSQEDSVHSVPSKDKTASRSNKKKRPTEDTTCDANLTCAVCKSTFPSKNKLFLHLSRTGHSVNTCDKDKLLDNIKDKNAATNINKKGKSRKGTRNT